MSAAPDLFAADRPAAAPPSATSPTTIRAAVERERRTLARLGQFGPAAEARAVAITRAKLGNAPDLAERQAHDGRCHACGEPLDDSRPVVAVCTGRPKVHLWLHAGPCHDEHRRRHAERIDAFMAAAGFPILAGAPAPAHQRQGGASS